MKKFKIINILLILLISLFFCDKVLAANKKKINTEFSYYFSGYTTTNVSGGSVKDDIKKYNFQYYRSGLDSWQTYTWNRFFLTFNGNSGTSSKYTGFCTMAGTLNKDDGDGITPLKHRVVTDLDPTGAIAEYFNKESSLRKTDMGYHLALTLAYQYFANELGSGNKTKTIETLVAYVNNNTTKYINDTSRSNIVSNLQNMSDFDAKLLAESILKLAYNYINAYYGNIGTNYNDPVLYSIDKVFKNSLKNNLSFDAMLTKYYNNFRISGKTNESYLGMVMLEKSFELFRDSSIEGNKVYKASSVDVAKQTAENVLSSSRISLKSATERTSESTLEQIIYDIVLNNPQGTNVTNYLEKFVVSCDEGYTCTMEEISASGTEINIVVKLKANNGNVSLQNAMLYIEPYGMVASAGSVVLFKTTSVSHSQAKMFVIPFPVPLEPIKISLKGNYCLSLPQLTPGNEKFDQIQFSNNCCSMLNLNDPVEKAYYNKYCTCYTSPSLTPGNASFNPTEFSKVCCSSSSLTDSDRQKYCSYCSSKVCFDGDCTEIDGKDIVTEIKSIEGYQNIKTCILGKSDQNGNTYEATNVIKNNPYCNVYCKEDYILNLPNAVRSISSGTYFTLRTTLRGTKTCYTNEINHTRFNNDITSNNNQIINIEANIVSSNRAIATASDFIIKENANLAKAKDDKERESIQARIDSLNNQISSLQSSIQSLKSNLLALTNSQNIAISNINSCTSWSNTFKISPKIEYTYDEQYIDLITNNNDNVFVGNTNIVDSSDWNCEGTINDEYNACSNNTESFRQINVRRCDSNYNCLNTHSSISNTRYLKKEVIREGVYQPKATFYSKNVTGEITLNSNNASSLGSALPVSLGTRKGAYVFAIKFANIGEFYDKGTLGRLIGDNGLSRTCSEANKDYMSYVCNYLVNCPECDFFCTCSDNTMDGYSCVKEDQYTCVLENDEDNSDCPDCAFDDKLKYFYRTISLKELNPNKRDLGYNWSTAKGTETLNDIETNGDNAYQKASYTFTLTPSATRAIRNYNKKQESSGGYADNTLNCSTESGYEDLICKSTFLDKIESGEINVNSQMERKWTLWTKGITSGTGPAWK